MRTSVLWFRRDLRLEDNGALVAAAQEADRVVGLFVLDDRLWGAAGAPRQAHLLEGLRALDSSMGGALVVRRGDPVAVVLQVARESGAASVFVTADFGPYGSERDLQVEQALAAAGVAFERADTPYVVEPGGLLNKAGQPFRVFTPFYRAWQEVADVGVQTAPEGVVWADDLAGDALPPAPDVAAHLPDAGEQAARRLQRFLEADLAGYAEHRDQPARPTSGLSPDLKWGFLHPRQVLTGLGGSASEEKLRSEVVWREFYAHVLHHWPSSARQVFQPKMAAMRLNQGRSSDERFAAWAEGETGYPLVDAGMRQLRAQAWMHNRVRMITASFLVKDLHIDWARGARLFMQRLVDGDLASNSHGWQWVAGTGTDAAPYFRVFNPVTQAKRFDPEGEYIRRWVPELAALPATELHEPWKRAGGPPAGYPWPIVDHAEEREEALARLQELA